MAARGHDPYCYPGTTVLINRFDVREQDALDKIEGDLTIIRLKEIASVALKGDFDFAHLRTIHAYIFQDVFDWAGQIRTIDIEKPEFEVLGGLSVPYSKHREIEAEMQSALRTLHAVNWGELSRSQVPVEFAKHFANLWRIHPFREGNTRTTTHFVCQFCDACQLGLDRSVFEQNSRYLRNALVAYNAIFDDLGNLSKPEFLERMLRHAFGCEDEN